MHTNLNVFTTGTFHQYSETLNEDSIVARHYDNQSFGITEQ